MRTRSGLLVLTTIVVGTAVAACASDAASRMMAAKSDPAFAVTTSVSCNQTLAPSLMVSGASASPNTLWPPNHKMWPVTVSYAVTGNCVTTPTCGLSVSSNEPINGLGDGNTAPDWIVTSPTTLQLRAERSGLGSGRVYTIGVSCTAMTTPLAPTLAAPISSATSTQVTVAHDQGSKS